MTATQWVLLIVGLYILGVFVWFILCDIAARRIQRRWVDRRTEALYLASLVPVAGGFVAGRTLADCRAEALRDFVELENKEALADSVAP